MKSVGPIKILGVLFFFSVCLSQVSYTSSLELHEDEGREVKTTNYSRLKRPRPDYCSAQNDVSESNKRIRPNSARNEHATSDISNKENRVNSADFSRELTSTLATEDQDCEEIEPIPIDPKTSTSSSEATLQAPKISKQLAVFGTKLKNLKNKKPISVPSFSPIQSITVEDEVRGGSRRWVKSFAEASIVQNENEVSEIYKWHTKKNLKINALKKISQRSIQTSMPWCSPVSKTTNFAKARLTFVVAGRSEIVKLRQFFLSGWPSKDVFNGNAINKFSQNRALTFLTASYKNGEQILTKDRAYDWFSEDLRSLFKQEGDTRYPIDSNRLQTHSQNCEGGDLARLYFHSEQPLRFDVQEEIVRFKKKNPFQKIDYIILDICSYYDMCWCCGDSLFMSFYKKNLLDPQKNPMVFIRASGGHGHSDFHPYVLRDHRHGFPDYESGQAYILPTNAANFEYGPYIAHVMVEDFQ